MSAQSSIQWTDSTHNFWRGCAKVSAGCANCYAEALVTTRLGGQWGKGAPRTRSKNFDAPLAWNKKPWICDVCARPSDRRFDHSCTGRPEEARHTDNVTWHRRRVFSLSLADWLDPEVPVAWLAEMLDVIRRCPNLTWQLVTKRPELFDQRILAVSDFAEDNGLMDLFDWIEHHWLSNDVPQNLWIIASTEDQEQLDKRIPALLKIPAIIHGLSCEPLLGPLNLASSLGEVELASYSASNSKATVFGGIEWVIIGGESGPKARPCHVNWIRDIVRQCKTARVPVFVKQLGAAACDDISDYYPEADINDPECEPADIAAHEHYRHNSPLHLEDKKGGDWSGWPGKLDDLRIRQFPPS